MSILELRDLRVRYGSGHQALMAVDGVSLSIPDGATLGLVGESGCGKSSLARAILGLVPIVSGKLTLAGTDATPMRVRNASAYRRRVQMVFQDPSATLNPRMTIEDVMGEALRLRGRLAGGRGAANRRMTEILDTVGLSERALDRYPHEFSGGQRQRIAIARALAVEPELIVTDEVTSSLDVSVQATILNLLRDLQREFGISYLFISHDLSTVKYMSDSVAVMYLGRIVEAAEGQELFTDPRHPYTGVLTDSIPQVSVRQRKIPLAGEMPDPRCPPAGCRFHTRCPIGPLANADRTICIESDPAVDAPARLHHAACHFAEQAAASAPAGVSERAVGNRG